MQNKTGQPEHWLAEIDFWCFDELQLFVVDAQINPAFISRVRRKGFYMEVCIGYW